jgi:hypothetical protein
VSPVVEAIMRWYSKSIARVDRLRPAPKYVFWIAFYSLLFLVLHLIWPSPYGLRWSDFLVGPVFGVLAAFGSERRRKHPKPPVTRYTNPRLLDEDGR